MAEKKQGYRGYTPAQGRASRKWNETNLEQLAVRVKKGTREKYKAAAAAAGMPFVQFLLTAMDEKIARDHLADSPRRISVHGKWCSPEEALELVDLETILPCMDKDVAESVRADRYPCGDMEFLLEYLARAQTDLVVR